LDEDIMDFIEQERSDYQFREDLLRTLQCYLDIKHEFSLDKRGQKHLNITILFAGQEVCDTSILIGQYKDLHDYSTDFTEQIL